MKTTDFLVSEEEKFSLKKHRADFTGEYKSEEEARADLDALTVKISELQEKFFAQEERALLLVFQGMDTAGKDAAIKQVMTGVNPQGFRVESSKKASEEELKQDYLRRFSKKLPDRGIIGIFNRSYYEEVLINRVHAERLDNLPAEIRNNTKIWRERFEHINNFEKYLTDNGFLVLKFFLNVSKREQKTRILERINNPDENWKFSKSDVEERGFWNKYVKAYEEAIAATATKKAPWYIVPADHRWFTHVALAQIVVETLESLKLEFPEMDTDKKREMQDAKEKLENE